MLPRMERNRDVVVGLGLVLVAACLAILGALLSRGVLFVVAGLCGVSGVALLGIAWFRRAKPVVLIPSLPPPPVKDLAPQYDQSGQYRQVNANMIHHRIGIRNPPGNPMAIGVRLQWVGLSPIPASHPPVVPQPVPMLAGGDPGIGVPLAAGQEELWVILTTATNDQQEMMVGQFAPLATFAPGPGMWQGTPWNVGPTDRFRFSYRIVSENLPPVPFSVVVTASDQSFSVRVEVNHEPEWEGDCNASPSLLMFFLKPGPGNPKNPDTWGKLGLAKLSCRVIDPRNAHHESLDRQLIRTDGQVAVLFRQDAFPTAPASLIPGRYHFTWLEQGEDGQWRELCHGDCTVPSQRSGHQAND